ncbi:hypothetical protein STEG23_002543 [Scotinomys teguina]
MDLFGDLPEPERAPRPPAGIEAQEGPMFLEDLPQASSTDSGTVFRLSRIWRTFTLMISHLLAVVIQMDKDSSCKLFAKANCPSDRTGGTVYPTTTQENKVGSPLEPEARKKDE